MKLKTNTMRWLPVVAMMIAAIAGCNKENELEPNPLAKEVAGTWWTIFDQEGTFAGSTPYTRVGTGFRLNEDGTGYGATFYFGDESGDPIAMRGGESFAPFTYTTTADGLITLQFDKGFQPDVDYFKGMTLRYVDGHISIASTQFSSQLEKADERVAALIREWDLAMNGGASADNYNINDVDFTPTTWRDQEAIYIYDGAGKDATDAKGRTGYTLVNMPWYKGDVLTNLPNGFCDDLTPENGWEWVLNRCGSRAIMNNNFFALYNKYSGILRFFYYMPYGFSTGNDHVWQVSMTDHLAQHSNWRYGLPSDKTITDKAAIGQTGQGTYMTYITPWTNYRSDDGLIVPNAGWWAFDVNLSTYRPDEDFSADNIRLQMRSWNTQHTSLHSTMMANIDGTIKADLKLDDVTESSSNSAQGIMLGLSAIAHAASAVVNFITGDIGSGLSEIGYMADSGGSVAEICGAENPQSFEGSLDGTITLGLNGTIDTEGVIRGSAPTVGIASPTIQMKDFDLKNTHVGQGVWNLKTAPVVYWIGVLGYTSESHSPYFFNPASVEVELNPDVFPESEIEWMQVDGVCGAKASQQASFDIGQRNPLDEVRIAYGAGSLYSGGGIYLGYKTAPDYLYDFLYGEDDKLGLDMIQVWFEKRWDGTTCEIKGRGKNGYAIEPQSLFWSDHFFRDSNTPFLEVNVSVRVKLKGMSSPVVLSRTYLPEIKRYNAAEFCISFKNRPYANKLKNSDLYNYQLKRIKDIADEYGLRQFDPSTTIRYIATEGSYSAEHEHFSNLFDGDIQTIWFPGPGQKKNGVWFVEFETYDEPITVNGYALTTGDDLVRYPGRNPKDWKLMAKRSKSDEWTTIATVTGDTRLPAIDRQRVEYQCDVKGQTWKYFRIEISNCQSGDWMQLSQLELLE